MTSNLDEIEVTFGLSPEIYEYYKIRASRNGTDIDTQLILAIIDNMNENSYSKEN